MDPRTYFFSQRKQRHHNPSLRSELMSNNLLNFTGGPLNVQSGLTQTNNNHYTKQPKHTQKQSPLQQHASFMLSERGAIRQRSMLNHNNQESYKGNHIKLDLSDRDRYYFKRTGSVDQSELLARNSMAEYIKGDPISHDKIYGKHTVIPQKHEDIHRYLGYSSFSPKLLTNADEVKNIIFGI